LNTQRASSLRIRPIPNAAAIWPARPWCRPRRWWARSRRPATPARMPIR
jgi:hypothetical protein